MAEGDSLYKEPIATEPQAYSSDNLILVNNIKKEPEEESEPGVLQLLDVEQPLSPPTPQPSQAQYVPVAHQVWAGVNSVVSPVVLESPLRPATFAGHSEGQVGQSTPTKWQEAYNLYLFHEETNRKARQSVLDGCITFAATQRIYMNSLQECRRLNSQGKLGFLFPEIYVRFWQILQVHRSKHK